MNPDYQFRADRLFRRGCRRWPCYPCRLKIIQVAGPWLDEAGLRRCSLSLGGFGDVSGLRTLLTLDDFKFDRITLLQTFVSVDGDRTVVDEHVRPFVPANKAIAFCVVKPLHSSFQTFHGGLSYSSSKGRGTAGYR